MATSRGWKPIHNGLSSLRVECPLRAGPLGRLARLQVGAVSEVFPQAGEFGLWEDLTVFFTAPVARRRQPGGPLCAAKPCPASVRS
jgi:hypothetical protein